MKRFSVVAVSLLCLGALGCGPQGLEEEGAPGEVGENPSQLWGRPEAPARLLAIPGPNVVTLSWLASPGATSYRVYYRSCTEAYSDQHSWTTTATTNYDQFPRGQVFYQVAAIANGVESLPSPEATATAWVNVAVHQPAAQSTNYDPTYALAGAAVDDNLDGNWFHGSVTSTAWGNGGQAQWWRVDFGATKSIYTMDIYNRTDCCSDELAGVYIFRSIDPFPTQGSWSFLTYLKGPAGYSTTLDLFGVDARHVMLQRDVLDRALMLAEVRVYGTPEDNEVPTVPGGLTATVVSSTRIDLKWNNSSDNVGVKNYVLYRCTGATCTGYSVIRQAVPNTTFSLSDTAVTAGKTYRYRIRAQDFAGNLSDYSPDATVTTP